MAVCEGSRREQYCQQETWAFASESFLHCYRRSHWCSGTGGQPRCPARGCPAVKRRREACPVKNYAFGILIQLYVSNQYVMISS
jgi:hypothetical protein